MDGDQVRTRSPGLQPQRAEPPPREPAAALHLAVAPVERRAVVAAEAERVAVGEPRRGAIEEIEQGLHGRPMVSRAGRPAEGQSANDPPGVDHPAGNHLTKGVSRARPPLGAGHARGGAGAL